MSLIAPIPTTRVSDQLFSQRLLLQLQQDQLELFRLQNQTSTGRRIALPSEDAPAALRSIGLQRLLEQKNQAKTNLVTNQSYLAATDTALTGVSNQLAEIRGLALSVVDAASTDTQRSAAVQQVNEALRALVDVGNQQFRGRYLFAGSQTTVRPFEFDGSYVRYDGNERSIQVFADVGVISASNVDGDSVFGALSEAVQGVVDLNPVLSENTRIADLRQGQGVAKGSILLSDGTSQVTIDLSSAETIGDVARLIEAKAPPGNTVSVDVTATGLLVQVGSGNLTIREVGGGITAGHLGILMETGNLTGTVVGTDLDPRLTATTALDDILGSRAIVRIPATGNNNDLVIEANTRGAALNGISVSFVNNAAVSPGSEVATYDAPGGTLVVEINSGFSSANDVLNAINNDPLAGAAFTARLDGRDTDLPGSAGTGPVEVGGPLLTAGGAGIEFDQDSGIRVFNGGQEHTLSFATAETVEDLLNILGASPAGLLGQINAEGTGIDVRSRLGGSDFWIGENGGTTAAELGIRSLREETALSDLNLGIGLHTIDGTDLTIRRADGVDLDIDLTGAVTIADVLERINGHTGNGDGAIVARLATIGSGIEIVNTDLVSTQAAFAVRSDPRSEAAVELGLVPVGLAVSDPAVVEGAAQVIRGRDPNPQEVAGVFTALLRLRDALQRNDPVQLSRSIQLLDDARTQLNFALAEVGARQQALDVLHDRLETEEIQLADTLSQEIDTDIAETITKLTARQTSFEASLRLAATTFRLTLLDFL